MRPRRKADAGPPIRARVAGVLDDGQPHVRAMRSGDFPSEGIGATKWDLSAPRCRRAGATA
jgi:hypothetical protein